ncbi:hypothetical protein HK097_006892, partial [Rhizophlyctis rosea]
GEDEGVGGEDETDVSFEWPVEGLGPTSKRVTTGSAAPITSTTTFVSPVRVGGYARGVSVSPGSLTGTEAFIAAQTGVGSIGAVGSPSRFGGMVTALGSSPGKLALLPTDAAALFDPAFFFAAETTVVGGEDVFEGFQFRPDVGAGLVQESVGDEKILPIPTTTSTTTGKRKRRRSEGVGDGAVTPDTSRARKVRKTTYTPSPLKNSTTLHHLQQQPETTDATDWFLSTFSEAEQEPLDPSPFRLGISDKMLLSPSRPHQTSHTHQSNAQILFPSPTRREGLLSPLRPVSTPLIDYATQGGERDLEAWFLSSSVSPPSAGYSV